MSPLPDPQRGEIWKVDLNPTRGAEIQKARPCVFVNAPRIGRLPLRILVPITDWDERYEKYVWMIMLDPDAANGLTKTSAADAFQVRSASLERFLERVGTLVPEQVDRVAAAIALCVDAP